MARVRIGWCLAAFQARVGSSEVLVVHRPEEEEEELLERRHAGMQE
jgi:hypothetical protein